MEELKVLGVAVLCALVLWCCYQDEKDWQAYAAAHHCRATGKREGQIAWGYDANGRLTTTTESDQTIYACDGGEIRIR